MPLPLHCRERPESSLLTAVRTIPHREVVDAGDSGSVGTYGTAVCAERGLQTGRVFVGEDTKFGYGRAFHDNARYKLLSW